MEKTISVEYTINEAQVMLEVIDVAVRARGLGAAEAGLVLSRKIESKLKAIAPVAPVQEPAQHSPFAAHIIKP
jgi:hypothetical protein